MKMKNNFRKQLLVDFGVILGAVVITSGAIYFLSGDLTAQADKIVADKTLTARQTAAVGTLASLKSEAPIAADYEAAMGKLLPTHDGLINFPQWLTSVGSSHHVSVSFAFQGGATPAAAAVAGSDPFSLSASGSSEDLLAFITDIETQSQAFLLSIDSLSFTNDVGGYRLSATGKVFSRKP